MPLPYGLRGIRDYTAHAFHQEWCGHIHDMERRLDTVSRVAGAAICLAGKNARDGPDSVTVDILRDVLCSNARPRDTAAG